MQQYRYYRDDFRLKVPFADSGGRQILPPALPWEARFYTCGGGRPYVAARSAGGEYVNCVESEDGRSVIVIFNNHGLLPGRLECELTVHIPCECFSDGYERCVREYETGLTITSQPTACWRTLPEIEMIMPYIKGEAGKSPKISEQGTWLVWDDSRGGYYDTGVSASAGGNDEDAVEKDVVEAANLVLSYSGGDDEAATKEDIENEACRILNG